MLDLGIYGKKLWKTIAIFEISTLKFFKIEFLTHAVNFCIVSTFLKVRGPLFLKIFVRMQVHFIKHTVIINSLLTEVPVI